MFPEHALYEAREAILGIALERSHNVSLIVFHFGH